MQSTHQDNDKESVFDASFETRIFPNENGSITIKQICWPDEDVIVTIPIEQINNVCKALRRAKKCLQG